MTPDEITTLFMNGTKKISDDDWTAISFIIDIIDESMGQLNISFDEVDRVLQKLGYWKIFEDNKAVIAGAHDGPGYLVSKIRRSLQ